MLISALNSQKGEPFPNDGDKYIAIFIYGMRYVLIGLAVFFIVRLLWDCWMATRLAFTLGRLGESELRAIVADAHDANHESLHDRFWGRYRFIRRFWKQLANHVPKPPDEMTTERTRRSRPQPGRM